MNGTKRILSFSLAALFASLALFLALSVAVPLLAANYLLDGDPFTVQKDGHTYICYHLKDENEVALEGLAIAWGEDAEDTPEELKIPGEVTYNNVDYSITAIAPSGFRGCDFSKVTLPESIVAIKDEAFAYCQNIKSFQIPHLVEKIAPSTFMACKSLINVTYSVLGENNKVKPTYFNSEITEIGDHAFDSCTELRTFNCPSSVTLFGESCFQNCASMVSFYFPAAIRDDSNNITNYITVRPYAFADCAKLAFVYFEENMGEVDNYAFTDCTTALSFRYTGSSVPSYSRLVDGKTVKQTHWRDRYIATDEKAQIPIILDHAAIYLDEDYPAFRYAFGSGPIYLDSTKSDQARFEIGSYEGDDEYAIIYRFDTPTDDIEDCYNVSTGALKIPNELGGKKVRVIQESAFANHTELSSVDFNPDLVQICRKAFYNCNMIGSLNFTQCTQLKEVSYTVFQNPVDGVVNEELTSLILPDSLEYIADYGFANFTNVNTFHLSMGVKAIGGMAFLKLGTNITDATVKLILPNTLNDKSAKDAYFVHQTYTTASWSRTKYDRFYAVDRYAFAEANCLLSVEMEGADEDQSSDIDYACSFCSNAFKACKNLVRFVTSKNARYLGKDMFKDCNKLRELFLTTAKAANAGESTLIGDGIYKDGDADFPWCIDEDTGAYGGSLVYGVLQELVIYVDGASAPGQLDSYTLDVADEPASIQIGFYWNADTGDDQGNEPYKNPLQGGTKIDAWKRSCVPTYFNVDFANDIKYWNPKTGELLDPPSTAADYDDGLISFVKNTSNQFTVARYYCDWSNYKGTDLIDLSRVPSASDTSISSSLVEIGPEAFGRSSDFTGKNDDRLRQPGLYFILPLTVTKIAERAFFRLPSESDDGNTKGNGRFGIRILTYRDGSGNIVLSNETTTNDAGFATARANLEKNLDANKRGFCVISPSITSIGRLAFLNNIFEKIIIGANVTYIGAAAFLSAKGTTQRTTTTTIVIKTGNSIYTTYTNGIYYTGSNTENDTSKQILVYQTQNNTGALTIHANTKAIGFEACANTKYTSISLPDGLTTIYGAGFSNNISLTSVTGGKGLRYISSMENALGTTPEDNWTDSDYTEVWDDTISAYVDNWDYSKHASKKRGLIQSLYGAFKGCSNLATIDFTQMTQLRKIGRAAFNGCGKMLNMVGSKKYTYKTVNKSGTKTAVTDGNNTSSKVLDLSYCTNLRCIAKDAFAGCNFKFLHLPNAGGNLDAESKMYIGRDPEAPEYNNTDLKAIISDNKGIKVLVGETALYASPNYGSANNAAAHYGAASFGTKGNEVYYYARYDEDLPASDSTALYYWTKAANGEYWLFKNKEDAAANLPNRPTS